MVCTNFWQVNANGSESVVFDASAAGGVDAGLLNGFGTFTKSGNTLVWTTAVPEPESHALAPGWPGCRWFRGPPPRCCIYGGMTKGAPPPSSPSSCPLPRCLRFKKVHHANQATALATLAVVAAAQAHAVTRVSGASASSIAYVEALATNASCPSNNVSIYKRGTSTTSLGNQFTVKCNSGNFAGTTENEVQLT